MTGLYTTEHRTTTYASGPLLIAEHAEHVAYDELVEVVTHSGERRLGQVLEIEGDRMVVQVLGGTRGIDIDSTRCSCAPGPRACRSGPTSSGGSSTRWAGPPTASFCRRRSATSTGGR